MERRTPTTALIAALSLAGCADSVTLHPVALFDDPVPVVPPIAGHWRLGVVGENGVLEIENVAADQGRCREGTFRYRQGGEVLDAGSEVCFVEFNGHLVAEFRQVVPPALELHRQYLIRLQGDDQWDVCGAFPVWAMMAGLAEVGPVGYSLDALPHTVQENHTYTAMVVVAGSEPMRQFLEFTLPELALACDSHTENGFEWYSFHRMSPEDVAREQAANGAPPEE